MTNSKIRIFAVAGFALAGLAVAGISAADSKSCGADYCICEKVGWPGSQQCIGGDSVAIIAMSKGFTENGVKKLGIQLASEGGIRATAQGYGETGAAISGCQKTDYTAGSSSVYDTSGCSAAVGHRTTVYW